MAQKSALRRIGVCILTTALLAGALQRAAADDKTNVSACGSVPDIPGFALDSAGHPYPTGGVGYTPADAFNPISVANYIQTVAKTDHPQKICVMEAAAEWAMQHTTTATHKGRTVRWLPYGFTFSANPSAPDLQPGWRSGLGQGGMASALSRVHEFTDDPRWRDLGQELINSFDVPLAEGGVKNYLHVRGRKLLWYEEYPIPGHPTSVLNGNNYAVIALDAWANRHGDPLARRLADEALRSYPDVLPLYDVPYGNGAVPASYDLVRGFGESAALRLVPHPGATITSSTLNGVTAIYPRAEATPRSPNLLADPTFTAGGAWKLAQGARVRDGRLQINPRGTGHVIATQTVAAGPLVGKLATVSWTVRHLKEVGGPAPRTQVLGLCGGTWTSLMRDIRARGSNWGTYHRQFEVPANCTALQVGLTQSHPDQAGGRIEFDSVELRLSDPLGSAWRPNYDYFVHRTPSYRVGLTGSGKVTVQAHVQGLWQDLGTIELAHFTQSVRIPERFTGRNVNLRYHEGHISELEQLHRRSGMHVFTDTVERWRGATLNTPE